MNSSTGLDPQAYQLILPAGWRQFAAGDQLSRELGALLKNGTAQWADDDREAVRSSLTGTAGVELAAAGVLALYAPAALVAGVPLSCSFAVSTLARDDETDPFDVLLAVAQRDESSRVVDLDGSVALRTQAREPVESSSPQGTSMVGDVSAMVRARRRVQYLIGVPDDPRRWVLITYDGQEFEGGRTLADAAIELFDSIVMTFRWVG